jgi:hypothetical protein
MTQQTGHDQGSIPPPLQTKLRRFVGELTPEELAALRSGPASEAAALPPSLAAKAERAAEELTPEEEALLDGLAWDASPGAANDVRGHLKAVYESPFGWKGRGPDPSETQAGGSNLSGRGSRFVSNLQAVFGPDWDTVGDALWPF